MTRTASSTTACTGSGRTRPRGVLVGAALLLLLSGLLAPAGGCTITRVYRGSPVEAPPDGALVPGLTSKGEVLRLLGPPTGIVRQLDGDIFVYRYLRRNTNQLRIEEPVITSLEIFSYTRSDERTDTLVVLFDPEGRVVQYGYAAGTDGL